MDYSGSIFESHDNSIKDFFSSQNKNLRNIYFSLRNKKFPYNKISSFNLREAYDLYQEYFSGMKEYVDTLLDLQDSDSVDSVVVENAIKEISKKDKEFINSILGGERNSTQDMNLDTAMENVEFLIEMKNGFSTFKDDVENVDKLLVESTSENYKEQKNHGVELLKESVSYFHERAIEEAKKCYEGVLNSMKVRVPVNGIKEIPTYQLF